MIFIDTNIAIALRDRDPETIDGVEALGTKPLISTITRIELENGVHKQPELAATRRVSLERVLEVLPVEFFNEADILAYGLIVGRHGHDRPRTLDRLIAAQAISRDAALVTRNGKDFRRIDGLKLVEW